MTKGSASGFTLVEILVVVSIIAILSTLVIVKLSGYTDRARVAVAKSHLSQIESAIRAFREDAGRLPISIDELITKPADVTNWQEGGYLKGDPADPWGHPYVYIVTATGYQVICHGRDGREGGTGYDADLSVSGSM